MLPSIAFGVVGYRLSVAMWHGTDTLVCAGSWHIGTRYPRQPTTDNARAARLSFTMLREQTFSLRTTAREQILIITSEVEKALGAITGGDGIAAGSLSDAPRANAASTKRRTPRTTKTACTPRAEPVSGLRLPRRWSRGAPSSEATSPRR